MKTRLTDQQWTAVLKGFLSVLDKDPDVNVKAYCRDFGHSEVTFRKVAKRFNLDISKPVVYPDQDIVLEQLDSLNGHLLGDGSLVFTNPKKNYWPVFSISSKHPEYLSWVVSSLELAKERPIWVVKQFDHRTNRVYEGRWLRSLSSPFLLEQRTRWYPNGTKVIPEDLVFTPKLVLRWFMDDGGRAQGGGINLATNCFSYEEIQGLCARFSELAIKARPHRSDKGQYRIYIPTGDVNTFLDYVGSCPVRCFDYKWQR